MGKQTGVTILAIFDNAAPDCRCPKNSRMVHGVSFDFKQFDIKGQIFVKTGKLSAFEY